MNSSSSSGYQLPTDPQLGLGLLTYYLIPAGFLSGLVLCRLCACYHKHCGLTYTAALWCPDNMISLYLSAAFGSYNLSACFSLVGHRNWGSQTGTDQEASSLRTSSHSIRRCYTNCTQRKAINCPTQLLSPWTNHKNDWLGKISHMVQ